VNLDDLALAAPKMSRGMSVDEYIDELAVWLKSAVGIYTPDLLMALIRELAKRDRRLKYITPKKVRHRLYVLEKKGLVKLRVVR